MNRSNLISFFNSIKLLILIFDWDEKALIILQVQIMKIEWKLYLEMKRKFSKVSHI